VVLSTDRSTGFHFWLSIWPMMFALVALLDAVVLVDGALVGQRQDQMGSSHSSIQFSICLISVDTVNPCRQATDRFSSLTTHS